MRLILVVVLFLLVVGLLAAYEFGVWQECLSKNSWLFCLRVLVLK